MAATMKSHNEYAHVLGSHVAYATKGNNLNVNSFCGWFKHILAHFLPVTMGIALNKPSVKTDE